MNINRVYTEPLTPREREVALAVSRGLGNRDIAGELGIGAETVKHHLSNVYDKLGVRGRLALAVLVLRDGVGGDLDREVKSLRFQVSS